MTENELWGPWLGNAMHMPLPTRSQLRRVMFWRYFSILAAMAVVGGALVALSH